ncbi:Acetylornithine deacetylase/succinyldiaminopimelate desuccinylase-like deacylase [Novosphingobium resinovorum]|uniref:Acetylornithine deacetylase/succinyldiaminopimelate desuccinylase-like deacylase n=1 Tax=Novosphingobium resinovorum TaxID=158500 RepID=A0A031JX98_9SPHN|nr:hydrolase [Novosphingobium resinovorum]EZP81413.1 Acetylornithine deacetylase/succinyldiaminopimelate desuccinylase-like deacylase [Novosphingobium resinovorum]
MSALSGEELDLLEAIEHAPILDRTLDWAAINSGTGNLDGLAAMADRLAHAFAALPGEVRLVDPAPVEKVDSKGQLHEVGHGRHLVLSVRPEADHRVILTGHMDTVYAREHPFQSCTWLDADTLNGPGTADMKGGLSLMLAGLLAFEQGTPMMGYDVLINSDEETGSLSSAALIAQLAQGKLAALTYEPGLPDGAMARARPGSGNYAAVVTGLSAHAGRNPQDGRNAVLAASDLALRLAAGIRDGLTINPARIEGGAPNNTVPDLAILHFNLRPRSPELAEVARALVEAAVAEVSAVHDLHIHLHGHVSRPPKPITPKTEALFGLVSKAATDLGQPMRWQDTGGVCDGNNIAACGVPVLDTMGALGGSIHSPQEFMIASSLDARARLTALVLHRLDRGALHA